MVKYIIAVDQQYYPYIKCFDSLKEAMKEFQIYKDDEDCTVYIAKVHKHTKITYKEKW